MFIITAAVYLLGAIGFVLLGSGEPEPWATQKPSLELKEIEEQIPLKENSRND